MFIMVIVGTMVDIIIGNNSTITRCMVISYYVATEGLSILENVAACGVPLPKKLLDILEQIKSNSDET